MFKTVNSSILNEKKDAASFKESEDNSSVSEKYKTFGATNLP